MAKETKIVAITKHHPKSAGPVKSTENSKWKLSLYVHHLEYIINSNPIKNVGQNIYFWNIQKLFKNIYKFFQILHHGKVKVHILTNRGALAISD